MWANDSQASSSSASSGTMDNRQVMFLVVIIHDTSFQGDREKPFVLPIRCYVCGNDDTAFIRFPPKFKTKKERETFQRVLLDNEPVPNDWLNYQCHILHQSATIEEAFRMAKAYENAKMSTMNDFSVPNENGSELPSNENTTALTHVENDLPFPTETNSLQVPPNLHGLELPPNTNTMELTPDMSAAEFSDMNDAQSPIVNADAAAGSSSNLLHPGSSTSITDASGNQFFIQTVAATNETLNENLSVQPVYQGSFQNEVKGELSSIKETLADISQQLGSVKKQLKENGTKSIDVAEQVQNVVEVLNRKENLSISLLTIDDMNSTFGFSFPLSSMTDFLDFEDAIKKSQEKRKKLLEFISHRLSKKPTINKTMAAVLKIFMEPNLLQESTATKKNGDKLILCDTEFYKVLEGPFRKLYTDKDGNLLDAVSAGRAVGGAINNSSDWKNGARALKRKRQSNEQNENNQ